MLILLFFLTNGSENFDLLNRTNLPLVYGHMLGSGERVDTNGLSFLMGGIKCLDNG